MKLPRSVRIGYLDYVVKELPQEEAGQGDFERNTQTIRVRSINRTSAHAANTLLHEISHGIFYHTELLEIEGMTDAKEEQIVNGIANGLSQVIADNPGVIAAIVKGLKK